MGYRLAVDGIPVEIVLTKDKLNFKGTGLQESINLQDVIGCENRGGSCARRTKSILKLWVIEKRAEHKLGRKSLELTGDYVIQQNFKDDLTQRLTDLPGRPKSLLVIINPICGNGSGKKDFRKVVSPVFRLANITCDVIVSRKSKHVVEIANTYNLDTVDGVVLLGGDGTYHEFINSLLRKVQTQQGIDCNDREAKIHPLDKPIAMIPSGTANVVCETATGCRCALTSALHVLRGRTSMVNLIGVYADGKLISYAGMGLTYGFITDVIYYADRKYRWLGRLRYVVVPIWMFLIKSSVRTYEAEISCFTRVMQVESQTADSTPNNRESIQVEGRVLTEFKSYSNTEVKFQGKYKNITCLNGNMFSENGKLGYSVIKMLKRPRHVYSTMIYKGEMTNQQIVQHFQNVENRTEEETDDSFCHALNIRGMKIQIKPDDTKKIERRESEDNLEHFVQVDGEIYEIQDLTFVQEFHQAVVPIYTDFLQET